MGVAVVEDLGPASMREQDSHSWLLKGALNLSEERMACVVGGGGSGRRGGRWYWDWHAKTK